MPSFNLVDEPWLPALDASGGTVTLSLREALLRAPALREIFDPSPLVTAALHRLLLAVLHRTHGTADMAAWCAVWRRGEFDAAALNGYLDEWRPRFDLFDAERPFYQVPRLDDAEPL